MNFFINNIVINMCIMIGGMMKKVLVLLLCVMFFANCAVFADVYNKNYVQQGVVTLQLPDYTKFYSIDPVNISVKHIEPNKTKEKNLTSAQKKTYKQVKKIEKYIDKKNFKKALEVDELFLPTRVQYMNYCLVTGDYVQALDEMLVIQRLNKSDKVLDDEKIKFKLGMLYYLNRNYTAALNLLLPFENKPNPENLWFALADIYYNQSNYNAAINYAKRIGRYSENYAGALELLYNSYYNLKNFQQANTCAKELISILPTPINYMRLGTTSSDVNVKLSNYYKARDIAAGDKNAPILAQADLRIISIEQPKIDRSVAGLKLFVEKPDWNKIAAENAKIEDPVDLSNRMVQFFQRTNACMTKFGGSELVKCYESVNNEQAKLTQIAKEEYQKACEARQRELEYQRQRMLIEQQSFYERMYLDDFFYLRHPYFFGLW